MSEKPKITTELFRFTSLRGPQLLASERRKMGFVFHPDVSKSVFLTALTSAESLDQIRIVLQEKVDNFDPIKTLKEARKIDLAMYRFSSWLMKYKNELTTDLVSDRISGLTELSEVNRYSLWDNLFYQILTLQSSYVRQACIQMLIADHFLRKVTDSGIADELENLSLPKRLEEYTEDEILTHYYTRVANSSVVVPKIRSQERKDRVSDSLNVNEFEMQRNYYNALEKQVKDSYSTIKKDTLTLHKMHTHEFKEAYTIDKRAISSENERLRNDFIKQSGIIDFDAELPGLDEINYVESNFSFDPPFSPAYLSKIQPSQVTSDFIQINGHQNSQLGDVLRDLEKGQKQELTLIYSRRKRSSNVRIAGIPIERRPSAKYSFTFGFRFPFFSPDKGEAYLLLKTSDPGVFVQSCSYTLSLTKTDVQRTDDVVDELDNEQLDFLFMRLFPGKTFSSNEKGPYKFDGQFALSNGDIISIHFSSHTKSRYFIGKAVVNNEQEEIAPAIYGVNKVGFADYRRVEQELCCYLPGEVSHIENVMAKEYKERSTRSLVSSEDRTETSTELEMENLSDTSTTDRNELHSEIENAFEAERSNKVNLATGVEVKFGERFKFNIGADLEFATSNSASSNNRIARTVAEDVTKRALSSVIQKVSQKRSSILKREFEENNRHGFDNRKGTKHVSGVYRWVDKIYTNRLVNYDKRLMYEFMTPEPSRLFKEAIYEEVENNENGSVVDENVTSTITVPPLSEFDINAVSDITYERAMEAANSYKDLGARLVGEITDSLPETDTQPFSCYAPVGLSSSFTSDVNHTHNELDLDVKDGYKVTGVTGTLSYVGRNRTANRHWITLRINGISETWSIRGWDQADYDRLFTFDLSSTPYTREQTLPVNVSGKGFKNHSLSGTMTLVRKDTAHTTWQNEIYAIVDQAYRDALLLQSIADDSQSGSEQTEVPNESKQEAIINPAFLREIEQRELKRICIELMTKPFPDVSMGKGWYQDETLDCSDEDETLPEVIQSAEFEKYASEAKFLEQAFQWDLMSYVFYPYFWGDKCDWKALINTQNNDALFQSFLRSGMARVVVPVRIGFEEAVTYYMNTGDPWSGRGLVVDSDDDLYLSIVEELKTVDGIVEDEWELRVPSSLTVIQSDSIGLDASGLPCCHTHWMAEGEEASKDKIVKTETILLGDSDGA
jgi:hypothetical protein